MPLYPAQIDNNRSVPLAINNNSPTPGTIFNKLRDAVLQVETELGIKPSGPYGTVQERFFYLENIVGNLKIIELRNDLGGTLRDPVVIQLQGRPLSDVNPGFNEILSWNGIAWIPQPLSALLPVPTDAGQALIWNGSAFVMEFLTQDDILPGYRFDLSNNDVVFFKVGETANPQVNVSYDLTPDTVIVSNDDSLPDEDVTSNVIAFQNFTTSNSYTKTNFDDTVTLTVNVSKGRAEKSINRVITWGQPLLWGVGLYVTGLQAFLDSLTNEKVSNTIDHSFQITAGAGEKIYFACRADYGDALFSVNSIVGGFTKVDTGLFDNGFGFIETFDLYESDNANLGTIFVNVTLDPII